MSRFLPIARYLAQAPSRTIYQGALARFQTRGEGWLRIVCLDTTYFDMSINLHSLAWGGGVYLVYRLGNASTTGTVYPFGFDEHIGSLAPFVGLELTQPYDAVLLVPGADGETWLPCNLTTVLT